MLEGRSPSTLKRCQAPFLLSHARVPSPYLDWARALGGGRLDLEPERPLFFLLPLLLQRRELQLFPERWGSALFHGSAKDRRSAERQDPGT